MKESARARDLRSSVDWLARAELVYTVPIAVGNDLPSFDADMSAFKLYCFDTGILRTLADLPLRRALMGSRGTICTEAPSQRTT